MTDNGSGEELRRRSATQSAFHEAHLQSLAALERRNRLRSLIPRAGADFASNDYLGLSNSPELRDAIGAAVQRGVLLGSGGSRLLRGNDCEHELLEAEAAAFFGAEAALFFASGFQANAALFATLPQRGDLIIHDELIHASAHDGMRLSRADRVATRHNDPQAVEDAVAAFRKGGGTGRVWIAVESLYSMDGDVAPLAELAAVAGRHEAMLVIDEAHATGVFGPQGKGLAADLEGMANVLTLHTCGKALGVMGGLVLGPKAFTDFLVNRCRPFIYSTAPSPLIAAGVRASLAIVARAEGLRRALHERIAEVAGLLRGSCGVAPTGSQIQPVIIGADAAAVDVASRLQALGFDIRAVRPPTVPEGTSRLRMSLTLNADGETTRALVAAVADELRRVRG